MQANLVSSLENNTTYGLLLLYAPLVQSTCANGNGKKQAVLNFEYRWFRENRKTLPWLLLLCCLMSWASVEIIGTSGVPWSTFSQETSFALGSCSRSTFPWTTRARCRWMSLVCLISHNVNNVGAVTVTFKQIHIVWTFCPELIEWSDQGLKSFQGNFWVACPQTEGKEYFSLLRTLYFLSKVRKQICCHSLPKTTT